MFCPRCGVENTAENKFCKSCGATLGAASGAQPAAAAPPAAPAQAAQWQAPAPPPPQPAPMPPQGPPPGMVPMVYQAYPGGPQQVYYVPAAQAHPQHLQSGFMDGLRSKIRMLSSTDALEGFSLKEMFKQVFKRHGVDVVEEYIMVGTSRTTPPLEQVETGWPNPWMFFRLLGILGIAFVGLAVLFHFTMNEKTVPAILFLGAFAVPLSTLVLIFEMNTPRNVSLVMVGKLFIVGGLTGLCTAMLAYMVPICGNIPGIVEESAKLLAVLLVVRTVRYKYELNGILFGATVGAGFACFETCGYGFDAILSTLTQVIQAGNVANGLPTAQGIALAVENMMANLVLRGVESPLGHVAWTAIAAGAFWRVKGDKPTSPAMLLDTRFLKAFAIPVLMHTVWDLSILFPNIPTIFGAFILPAVTGLITWYVLFGLVQQGLKQVKDEQVAHLQSTLATVEATLGLGTYRQPMAPAPVGTVPVG
ncbi:MAG: PrsW family intramembrane metalloprotease [Terracidiphilus sp.]|jgi:protease PrsW